MKRLIVAAVATMLVSGGAVLADATKKQPAKKVRPKIALMIEGKVTQEIHPTAEKDTPGVGTDYTFEWSGGKGDIIISE